MDNNNDTRVGRPRLDGLHHINSRIMAIGDCLYDAHLSKFLLQHANLVLLMFDSVSLLLHHDLNIDHVFSMHCHIVIS